MISSDCTYRDLAPTPPRLEWNGQIEKHRLLVPLAWLVWYTDTSVIEGKASGFGVYRNKPQMKLSAVCGVLCTVLQVKIKDFLEHMYYSIAKCFKET